jgi:hypothetical protein
MGQSFSALSPELVRFIARQKIFFVATATAAGRVNVSPKGLDSLRILGDSRVVWLNLTGSTNETSAHVQVDPRMTLMFCAFEGPPLILRLYGQAKVVHRADPEWSGLISRFPPHPGPRQIFDLGLDLVRTSCGEGVPLLDYAQDRDALVHWAAAKGEEGIRRYWAEKNAVSLDGLPTRIVAKGG